MKKKLYIGIAIVLALLGGAAIWWSTNPWLPYSDPHLADGVKLRILSGRITGDEGSIVFEMALPPNFVFPPHFHFVPEELQVVSGALYLGGMDGRPYNCTSATRHGPGDSHKLAPRVTHWGFTTGEPTIVRVSTEGPYSIEWVESPPLQPCSDPPQGPAET